MPQIAIRDLQIYYELHGCGSRVLYLGSTGSDLRHANAIFKFPFARSFAYSFELLAFDQRGFGQTSKPDRAYSMADYAADAYALLQALNWNSCAVIGVSFGGMVAQELAVRHPEVVERLVLCCTSSGGAGGSSYPLHELYDLPMEQRVEAMLRVSDTRRNAAWLSSNTALFERMKQQTLADQTIGADQPDHLIGIQRQLAARRTHDTYERLAQLTMPTLICGGRYDGIAPPERLHAMQQQIPNAQLVFFEGGHAFYQQDPRAFQHISEFLQSSTVG